MIKRFISRPNTRFKISEKVSVLLLVMVLLAVVNIGLIYTYHQQVEQAGNSVNVAGQQRMLSQRMVRFANDIANGDHPERSRERLRIAIERYDRNLDALRYGGMVTDTQLNPSSATDPAVPSVVLRGEPLAPAPAAAEDELSAEAAAWRNYKPHVLTVLNGDTDSRAFHRSLAYVRANSDHLLAVSDEATAQLAQVIRQNRRSLQQLLVVLLGVDVLVAVLGGAFARQYLGKPMADIATKGLELASGDLESEPGGRPPIDRSVHPADQRSELARLTRAFDEVQEYLQTVAGQSRALAAREFDADVFDETVPGELGESLEATHDDLQSYIHDLQTTTEKLDAIIEASPAAIVITDTRGNVRRWNPAAEEMFGWNESAVIDEPNPIIPDDQRDAYRERRSRVVAGESLSGVERKRVTREGEVIDVSIAAAAVTGPDGDIDGVMTVLEDITDRKARERTLRHQRDELELLGRVTDLILEITQELVDTSSRDRIDDLVCSHLADDDRYATAWIGETRGNGDVAFRTGRTGDGGHLEELSSSLATEIGLQAARAAAESCATQVRTVPGTTEPSGGSDDGTADVAAVPISYRETTYGVLVVQTVESYAYREQELEGMATLGKTIGFARNAITNKKLLFADSVVDLRFDVRETTLPAVRTSAALDCTAELDGFVVATDDEALSLYFVVDNTSAATFVDEVVQEPDVTAARIIADEEGHRRAEVTVSPNSPLANLSHHEVTLHSIEVDGGAGEYGFEAPLTVDVATVVEELHSRYPDAELVAKREKNASVTTAAELATEMESRLTDRQYEIFKTAYLGGYFEWPRDSTIEELAANVGIAGSTFHHHLRHAQRKLAAALLAPGSDE
ncbi:MAG: bacterio-opsin activator domain-containing protein [Halanaeroarchaeum sp.]